jgi:hypothetical protein
MDVWPGYMEEYFTFGNKLDFEQENIETIPRIDYVANKDAKTYVIAVDKQLVCSLSNDTR